jgi:streptomycin 3"-adenylyltransferase
VAVVERRLSPSERDSVARALAAVSAGGPILGDLEVSVLTSDDAQPFRHEPVRGALLLHVEGRDRREPGGSRGRPHRRGSRGACDGGPGTWRAALRAAGSQGLRPCPAGGVWDSVRSDVAWALDGDHLLASPFYGVLNACRMLLMLDVGLEQAAAYSKEEGGTWALTHVAPEHRPLVEQTLACYRSDRVVAPNERRIDGHAWDADALRAFRDDVRRRLALSPGRAKRTPRWSRRVRASRHRSLLDGDGTLSRPGQLGRRRTPRSRSPS